MRELTAPQADDLYELVTERAGGSLILTSNRAPADWYPLFPNPVVADIATGPAHQQRPPVLHERAELPAEQGTRVSSPPGRRAPAKIRTGQDLGNYLIKTPGE
jgi:hypothetical protein